MRVKKVLAVALSTALATATLFGCGNSDDSKAQVIDLNMEEVLAEKPSGEKIVVATNNAANGRDVWLLENAKEAGFNIEIVQLGGGDVTARVISEVNNPTLNVVWGPSEDQFTSMIDAGALVKFEPEWSDEVAGVSEVNGYSWPYEIQPKVLVCNPDIYTEETAPKSWSDLWEKEEYHGKYAVPTSFEGNTNRAIIGGILGQYLDENGELGVSEEGWSAIKKYFDNGYKTPKGEDDFGNMASGKVPITYTFASGLKNKCESFDVDPLIIYTEEGEPTNTNQIGVVANSDVELVKESMRFANWLGSAEVIGEYAKENGNMVANSVAEDSMVPIIKEVKGNYKPEDVDWKYINSMMDEWVAKIQLEIY
ncbi:MAG: extracellular solute-binding protein [Eubacteriales bacterium]|nr:extracellular solute-binding protein [Eubacteriales bacterium]